MAANIPDDATPGGATDASAPDVPDSQPLPTPVTGDNGYLKNVLDAYNQGYTYDDIVNHHEANDMDPPPRPDLATIMSGKPLSVEDLKSPGQSEGINAGAGPIGEALIMGAAGGAVGLAKGLVEGALEDAVTEVAGAATNSRAAQLGVQTTEDELGTMGTAGPATIEGASARDVVNMVAGNKWVRRMGGVLGAGEGTYDLGKRSGKE